jgi:hypothetical protein
MQKQGTLNAFPMHSYKNEWPSGKVDEVLVDCSEYYLISTKIPIIKDFMNYSAYKQGTSVTQPTTYDQLAILVEQVLQKYMTKSTTKTKFDWTGIDTPGDPTM